MPVVLGLGFTPAICTFIATGLAQETDIHAQLVARLEHIPGTGCRVLIIYGCSIKDAIWIPGGGFYGSCTGTWQA